MPPTPHGIVVLWGDASIKKERKDHTPGDIVWRLTAENESSFVAKLKLAVAKETRLDVRMAKFVHITDKSQIAQTLRRGVVSHVVWVGHVITMVEHRRGMLSLEGDGGDVEGDEFARMLPKGASVTLLGCDSTALAAQMRSVEPTLQIAPSKGDRKLNVEFMPDLKQTVHKVWFTPWIH